MNMADKGYMQENRKFFISVGRSRFQKVWKRRSVSWEQLRDKLSSPVRTAESYSDYLRSSRERQTEIKDVGGFVGSTLREGLRKGSAVVSRSVVTLDYDEFSRDRLEDLRLALRGWVWALHSTHKHSEEAWRVRVVIPLAEDVTVEEYGTLGRWLASRIGFEGIDRSTFEACRLMFWPSVSADGDWVFASSEEGGSDGACFFDGKRVLKEEFEDWEDLSQWPLLPEEEVLLEAGDGEFASGAEEFASGAEAAMKGLGLLPRNGRLEDPTQKRGLVGAFCREVDCREIVEMLAPGVYVPGRGRGRYTYVNGRSSSGACLIQGGKFWFSFHATDPLCGKMLNAWDLCRLLLFGHLDAGAGVGTRVSRLPSTGEMERFALGMPAVKARLVREQGAEDFAGIDLGDGGDSGEGGGAGSWEGELDVTKTGAVRSTIANVVVILRNHPELKGRIRRNLFSGELEVCGELPWRREGGAWSNTDESCLRVWLDRVYGVSGREKITDALTDVANTEGFHPVKDYLESLSWDGTERVSGLFVELLGAEDIPLYRELARMLLAAAVRRIFEPGVKFDYFIILQGPEGTGKSSLFSILGGEWFSDSVITIEGKEGMESIQGKWIIELGELIGMKRSEQAAVKGFISRQTDEFRPAYGRIKERHPRQCVLVGTTNEEFFLRGADTGNRRSPVVEIRPEFRRVREPVREWVAKWRDQLWAEAVVLARRGYPLFLDSELKETVEEIQDRHNLDKSDSRFPEVERFLEMLLPQQWDSMTQEERLRWLRQNNAGGEEDGEWTPLQAVGMVRRQFVTIPEILQEMLEMRKTDRDYRVMSREIGAFLNSLKGWKKIGVKKKSRLYGSQMTWERIGQYDDENSINLLDDL